MRTLRSVRGFTLMEILVSLLLMGVITTAVLNTYLNQHENYLIQEDISVIQQSARASLDELGRQIRMAGYGLPVGLSPILAGNANPDTITVRYQSSDCDNSVGVAMTDVSAPITCASSIACFDNNSWVYIFEPDSGGGEFFFITGLDPSTKKITHAAALTRKYTTKAIILEMYQAKFYVDRTDTSHPNLMVQIPGAAPSLYAENISDLQFRYRLKNGLVVDTPPLIEDVREVMISVVGRSSQTVTTANQGHQYRFRTYSTSVNMRNIYNGAS